MILSDKSIRRAGIVLPCEDRYVVRGMSAGLSSCGYDVTVDFHRELGPAASEKEVRLAPGQFRLVGIREHFNMPPDIVGFTYGKSTWSRIGLRVEPLVLEPGWKGYLTIGLHNGPNEIKLIQGDPIAQVVFHLVDEIPLSTYDGKYQDQEQGPQRPRFET